MVLLLDKFYLCLLVFQASEDCLILNVFVPKHVDFENAKDAKVPVMVWIHGGGFQIGSGMLDTFDSRLFVEYTDTIVVTINYRLC